MNRLLHENVYLDTNIFIAAVENFHAKALELLRLSERGILFLFTSEATRGEVLINPARNGNDPLISRYQNLFDGDNGLTTVALDRDIATEAAQMSARTGLDLWDAVHCATAKLSGCSHMVSQDRDMKLHSETDVISLDELEALT